MRYAMYNKIFTKILDSSIWLEPDATRLIWLTLLAAMDQDGFVQFASVANVAYRARVDLEAAQTAMTSLEQPDPDSSDPEFEGRRIERVPGGWMVLNALKYREIITSVVQREQTRRRVLKHREAKRRGVTLSNETVTIGNELVTTCNDPVTPSEAEAEAEAEAEVHTQTERRARALRTSTSPKPKRSARALTPSYRDGLIPDGIAERAGQLLEHYAVWYATYRKGARLRLTGNSLEFQDACSLVAVWTDQQLEKLARVVLESDDPFIANTDRGFKIFALKASWADDRLRQGEANVDLLAWICPHTPRCNHRAACAIVAARPR